MINEGLKSARELAIKSQIPENIFNKFNGIDFTPTKKYLTQMLKWYIANTELEVMDAQFIKRKLEKYNNALGKTIERQIESFPTFTEFESFVEEHLGEKTKPEYQKNVIFENDEILIIRPGDKETVCKYGKNTQWCITMNDEDTGDDDHYNRYRFEGGFTFYYCIIKDRDILTQYATAGNEEVYAKVCVLVSNDGILDSIYDSTDDAMDYEAFDNLMELCGVDSSQYETLFKPVPVTLEEKAKRILDNTEHIIQNGQYIIKGDVDFTLLEYQNIGIIPLNLKTVDGNVYAGALGLKSMENFPETCTGVVTVVENLIKYFPDHLKEYNSLDMSSNVLQSTKNIPTINDSLFLQENMTLKKLESLDKMKLNVFNIINTSITSLIGSPDALNYFCRHTPVESLDGLVLSSNRTYNILDFSNNNKLHDIEFLRTIPDDVHIISIRLHNCTHIKSEYVRKILQGKNVDHIQC